MSYPEKFSPTIIKDDTLSPQRFMHAPWWEYPDADFQTVLDRCKGLTLQEICIALFRELPDPSGVQNYFHVHHAESDTYVFIRRGKGYGKAVRCALSAEGTLISATVKGNVNAGAVEWSSFDSEE